LGAEISWNTEKRDGKWTVEMTEGYYSPTGAKKKHTHTQRAK
jgi:hypothetical protein